MTLTQFLVIAVIVAVLLAALVIYGRLSKSDKVLMRESCHGDCAHCSIECHEKQDGTDGQGGV